MANNNKYKLTANLQGCLQLQQDRLAEKDFARLEAQGTHLGLGQLHSLARATSSN